MTRHIAIVQGPPDPARHHLLHAMADAYAEAATAAEHEVRRIEVAKLEFPLLRTQGDFETGALPPGLEQAREDMRWTEHWVFLFPLWHGTMPALLRGYLEHIFRPGFAMGIQEGGLSEAAAGRALRPHNRHHGHAGASLPVVFRRVWRSRFRGSEHSMLGFAGIKPIRENFYGLCFADEKKRSRWLDEMRDYGRRAR